jgi:hypothetical protein
MLPQMVQWTHPLTAQPMAAQMLRSMAQSTVE